jgi:hypothetical protein
MRILIFLFLIFLILTLLLTVLGYIVGGPVWITPAIVSLFITAFVWLGLREANEV